MTIAKTCSVCGDPISDRSRTGLCKQCYDRGYHKNQYAGSEDVRETAKAKSKEYYEANKAIIAAKGKEYYEANKDMVLARHKRRYDEDPVVREAARAASKHYREAHLDENIAYHKKRYADNPERHKGLVKRWKASHPERVRELRREMRTHLCAYGDCTKLNKWFTGCDFHHLTSGTGIHIPAPLHRAVRHNLRTGEGMDQINTLAMDWLNGVRRESPQTTLEAFG